MSNTHWSAVFAERSSEEQEPKAWADVFEETKNPIELEEAHALALPHVEAEEPIDWGWAGGFYDGEGYLDATVRQYVEHGYLITALYTAIQTSQEDKSTLEKLRDFIETELGIYGSLYYDETRNAWLLHYSAAEDCYKLAKKLLPYLHLPKRRRQAKKLLETTKTYAKTKVLVERRPEIAEMWQRILTLNT